MNSKNILGLVIIVSVVTILLSPIVIFGSWIELLKFLATFVIGTALTLLLFVGVGLMCEQ